jgi:DNA-directed RNA polymerase specialized sigma24 family protein
MTRFPERAHQADAQRRLGRRRESDRLVELAAFLAPPDRTLIESIYRDGRTISDLARMMAVPRRTLQSRVDALLRRLNDPLFQFVARKGELLPRSCRAVARRVICEGQSQREAARTSRLTLHAVRKILTTTKGFAEMSAMYGRHLNGA